MEVERVGNGRVPMEVGFPYWSSHRRNFPPFDSSFVAGNEEREFLAKQYECLVEGCGAKLKNYQSRQQHLVDKHKFPTTFEFFKKAWPSKQDRQKLHHRQAYKQRSNTKGMEIDSKGNFKQKDEMRKCKQLASKEEEAKEMNMEVEEKVDELVSAVSRLTTSDSTPTSINFGHRHSKGLTLIPRSIQRTKKPVCSADGKI